MGLQQDPAGGIAHLIDQDLRMGARRRRAAAPAEPARFVISTTASGRSRWAVSCRVEPEASSISWRMTRGGAGRRYAPRQGDGCGDAEPQPPLEAEGRFIHVPAGSPCRARSGPPRGRPSCGAG